MKETTSRIVDFAVQANKWVKLEEVEKSDKYLDIAKELKKTTTKEHKGDADTKYKWFTRYSYQRISALIEDLELRGPVETIQTTVY